MTDEHDPDLRSLDAAARAASRGLHEHVARHVHPDIALATLPATPPARARGRFLAVAAVAALLVGSTVVLSDQQGGDDRSRLELDEDGNPLPVPQPGVLTALGPNDGLDSIQLPVTVEPNTGLHDRDMVTASSPGFEPGEQVGIVQCAKEAGGDTREERGGIDGCYVATVVYATADADGVATGRFEVRRMLTTPLTGTVDCAAEAERCLVAMGAINDYDRSGGFGIAFAGGGEPIELPTLSVTPSEGLADGDTVHVEGDGFYSRQYVTLSVCSVDPSACWTTGDERTLEGDQVLAAGFSDYPDGTTMPFIGLQADQVGHLEGDVPVWRYLPGPAPGTYVDCAVSRCSLRVTPVAGDSPPPVALGFTGGGEGPRPPAVAVDPDHDLAAGDTVVVRGAGFEPGSTFSVSLCLAPADDPQATVGCASTEDEPSTVDDDGGFALEFEIPDLADMGDVSATTTMVAGGDPSAGPNGSLRCDRQPSACTIQVQQYDQMTSLRPQFPPAPVPVTLRSVG